MITKEKIEEMIEFGYTRQEMADFFGVSKTTIASRLKHFSINLQKTYNTVFTKEYLNTCIFNEYMSIADIASEHKCSTDVIWKYIKIHNIHYIKNFRAVEKLQDSKWLTDEYLNKNKSILRIAGELSTSEKTVSKYIDLHELKRKPRHMERVWHVDIPIDHLSSGSTSKEIANQYGCSEEYIRQLQIKNNIDRLSGFTQSSIEREVCNILDSHDIDYITNTKKIISPYELDVYIPDHDVAIEIHGLYYHSDKFVDSKYHKMKRLMCESLGIRLIQIFEDDIVSKKSIVEGIIISSLGIKKDQRVFARKCKIVNNIDIATRREFMDGNHIQGFVKSTSSIGLEYDDEIVALMMFDGDILTRYATSVHVIGGFSKLVKNSGKSYIKTFVDYTTFTGKMYEKCGFKKINELDPDYSYVYKNRRFHKFNFRKSRFKNDIGLAYQDNLTERELASLNNIRRIYDAGKGVYVWQDQVVEQS